MLKQAIISIANTKKYDYKRNNDSQGRSDV